MINNVFNFKCIYTDDAQKSSVTCQWVHLKNKREEPIKGHLWSISQRPSEG